MTELPILVKAVRGRKGAGEILLPGSTISVCVIPYAAVFGILDSKKRKNFGSVFSAISGSELQILGLNVFLLQAVQTRSDAGTISHLRREADNNPGLRDTLKGFLNVYYDKPAARGENPEYVRARLMSLSMNRVTEGMRLVLWWSKEENGIVPGLYCDSFATALNGLLLRRFASPGGIGICQRCLKIFLRTKGRNPFCSTRCGNNARQSRLREKDKKEK